LLGLIYIVATSDRFRRRAIVIAALGCALLLIGAFTPVESLWSSRLENSATFDRPATWVSGLRIARDHPLTGVGTQNLPVLVTDVPTYSHNQFGVTTTIPHNTWLLALDVAGVPYLLAFVYFTIAVIAAVLARPRRRSLGDRYLVAALGGYFVVGTINNLFTHPDVTLVLLAILAIVLTPYPAQATNGAGAARPAHL